jgi:peptide/nickel transport system ATP-binding protein
VIVDVLRVENLSLKAFDRKGASIGILDSVCLGIPEGEITCLVGESGIGKTMLARTMAALLPAGVEVVSGDIFFREQAMEFGDLQNLRGSSIFYIPQDAPSSLNPVLKLKRQFTDFGSFSMDLIRQTLERFGFEEPDRILHAYPFQLSGGEAQRCLLVMAALKKPELLILDEPFQSLDGDLQIQVADFVRALRRDAGITMLVISHDMPMVNRIGDNIVELSGNGG